LPADGAHEILMMMMMMMMMMIIIIIIIIINVFVWRHKVVTSEALELF